MQSLSPLHIKMCISSHASGGKRNITPKVHGSHLNLRFLCVELLAILTPRILWWLLGPLKTCIAPIDGDAVYCTEIRWLILCRTRIRVYELKYKVTQKKNGNFWNAYVEMLQSFVAPALNNFPQLHEAWFQQDGATSHTARQSMSAVRKRFGNHIISRFGDIPWPLR